MAMIILQFVCGLTVSHVYQASHHLRQVHIKGQAKKMYETGISYTDISCLSSQAYLAPAQWLGL